VAEERRQYYRLEDVLNSESKVALTIRQPFFSYLLIGLTYGLTGKWETQAAITYLQKLQQNDRLLLDKPDMVIFLFCIKVLRKLMPLSALCSITK